MNDKTQRRNAAMWIAITGALVTMTGLSGCDQGQPVADVKKESPALVTESAAPAQAGDAKQDMSATATDTALMGPVASQGRAANDEGVAHAKEGHWDVAEGHFRKALEADPNLAEAHFNLGLALNSLGKHDEAMVAFKKAAELAPGNARITESPILKKHTST